MKAPDFKLPDQNGKLHTSYDYRGKWLVVYFYPRDETPGCTKEACSFRDNNTKFKRLGAQVIGISKDTVASHKKFENKNRLNFTILSDQDHKVIEAYGAWGKKKFMGKEYDGIKRNTYLVNPEGEIVKTYEGVNPLSHTSQVLQDLTGLSHSA